MDNLATKKELDRFENVINEIDKVLNENWDIFSNVINISQNGENGITSLLPDSFYFYEYNLENLDQHDENILNSLKHYKNLSNHLKNLFEKYKLIPYASILNPKLTYDFANFKTNMEGINIICKEIANYSGLLSHELAFTNFEAILKEEHNDKKDYILDLIKKLISHKRKLIDTIPLSQIDFELAVQGFDISIKDTISFERAKQENQEKFLKKLKEDTDLLVKSYASKIKALTEEYENTIKDYKLEINELTTSSELLVKKVDTGLNKIKELNEKTQKLDLDFSTIINEKIIKIEEELEIEKDKITNNINEVKTNLLKDEQTIKDAHQDFIILVQDTGIHKLTENYKKKASDENDEYKKFRRYTNRALYWAIGTAIVMFLISLFEIYFTNKDTDLLFFIYRMTISLMFFVLAFYSSKQAAKHYECFQENNRTYLQLEALEPFMERMSEDEKKEIRKTLIPTYFNQNADGKFSPHGEEIGLPSSLSNSVEKIAEILKSWKGSDSSKPN
ncbi:hypothetical protein KTH15_13405 [Acinetobacter pittii]|uniref:hypothetical protein n=1 Tax=Acinetobacter pittii TaxID=48296 RepID=UPI0021CD9687|nr:hypothetical protein [Acinetobacter pittii]MCU4341754.1 hypothetical protein [Acinetobacter pittii]